MRARSIGLFPFAAMAAALLAMAALNSSAQAGSDDEDRDAMIRQSIASYSGSCPCPYNVERAGRRCGGRSAYSRPGGESPLCYREDVSDAQLERWRQSRR